MKPIVKLLIICTALSSVFYTAQAYQGSQNKEPIIRGEKVYLSYCASCHGVGGAGDGPVASSLKQRPNDLRRIQSRYGVFPAEEVGRKISGALSAPVHGRKDMPVWGLILSSSDINHLVRYLRSIQRVYPPQPAE